MCLRCMAARQSLRPFQLGDGPMRLLSQGVFAHRKTVRELVEWRVLQVVRNDEFVIVRVQFVQCDRQLGNLLLPLQSGQIRCARSGIN